MQLSLRPAILGFESDHPTHVKQKFFSPNLFPSTKVNYTLYLCISISLLPLISIFSNFRNVRADTAVHVCLWNKWNNLSAENPNLIALQIIIAKNACDVNLSSVYRWSSLVLRFYSVYTINIKAINVMSEWTTTECDDWCEHIQINIVHHLQGGNHALHVVTACSAAHVSDAISD